MISDVLRAQIEAMDQGAYLRLYTGVCIATNIDGSVSIQPNDANVPLLNNVPFLGALTVQISPGTPVLFAFDDRGSAWLIGPKGNPALSDFVPMGTLLLAAINQFISLVKSHNHSGDANAPPSTAGGMVPIAGVLSLTARVQP